MPTGNATERVGCYGGEATLPNIRVCVLGRALVLITLGIFISVSGTFVALRWSLFLG